ncbi:hypothetical protein Droror1_Dr00022897 [Drosera rotundifolia]
MQALKVLSVVFCCKMGITGELVRSVFSKRIKIHESNARMTDRTKWRSVRAYLCGDEVSSMVAEEDSTTFNISDTTISRLIHEEEGSDISEMHSTANNDQTEEQQNPESKRLSEAEAAIIIQSAFRGFMVRHQNIASMRENMKQDMLIGTQSPGKESLGTSIEVQTGHSTAAISVKEEASAAYKVQNKHKPQNFRPKEMWDDSKVDSNVSKMRLQSRQEAMTRRERALAYAFSQQLRICSKKREGRTQDNDPHMGLSWLERWMATRMPENMSAEDCETKQLESAKKSGTLVKKKHQDLSFEEKESSGSNEVHVSSDNQELAASADKLQSRSQKGRFKATRNISRRKTVPTYHHPKQNAKDNLLKRR